MNIIRGIQLGVSTVLCIFPRRHGLVVRAFACEARGPGFDFSTDQMVFLLSKGIGGRKNVSTLDKLRGLVYPRRLKKAAN